MLSAEEPAAVRRPGRVELCRRCTTARSEKERTDCADSEHQIGSLATADFRDSSDLPQRGLSREEYTISVERTCGGGGGHARSQ